MKIILKFLNFFVLFSITSLYGEEISLISYCNKVLAYYPLLKKQIAITNESNEFKKQVAAYKMPRITTNGSYVNSNDPVSVFGALLKQNNFSQSNFDIQNLNKPDPVNNFNMTVYAEIPIFNAYQTKYSIDSAASNIEASKYFEKLFNIQILSISTQTYLQTLLSKKLFSITKKNFVAALEDMKQANDLKNKGVILGADFFVAKVILSNMEQMLNQFDSNIKTLNSGFNILIGEKPNVLVSLKGNLNKPFTKLPEFNSILENYIHNRPDISALRCAIQSKELELKKEQYNKLPKISAFTSAEINLKNFNENGTNYTAGIKGSFDLYDPTRTPKINKLKINLDELKNDETILKDDLLQKIYTTYEEYQVLSKNLKILHQSLLDSKESLLLLEPLYREGKKSIADLLEIRNSNLNVEITYFKTLNSLELKAIDLLFYSGFLNKNNINELSINISEKN